MAKQINVFVDNRIGRIQSITEALFRENINIRAMAIQDRGEFGLVKLIVDSPERAVEALQKNNFACKQKDVLAVVIEDKPGGLYQLLKSFPEDNVNILDAYGFAAETIKGSVFFIEVKDAGQVSSFLQGKGYKILTDQEVMEL
ncbi:MAG TPA: acetolactate synthase [Candidatus Omnitrophota bacterium]|nr:acetolactate synthase [Candidatus Omnitrophota bacterium]HQL41460.1 acetolactate synthase [Candidatus Omnitrophota bacterium]